jgi:protein phosphatase PTC1
VLCVSGAEEMNPRYRSTMEDAFVVVDGFGGDPDTGLFAVYDGHGGRFTAEFLRTHLHDNVERELRVKGARSVEECLKAAFLMTDIECAKAAEPASGSTAALCIVRRTGPKRYVYTANCGDARAVLCHGGTAVRLSMDHKATDEEEVARISALGGYVAKKRVLGVLAVARAFGDLAFKKYVTAEPYTSTTKLDASSEFIILACDGVWDVLSDEEAVAMVRAQKDKDLLPTSRVLVDEAIRRGSSDNITCLVIHL